MHIDLFTVPFIIIMGLLFSHNENKWSRLSYILLCGCLLLLIAALRSPEWMTSEYGIDTLVYKEMFEESIDMEWREFAQLFYFRYFGGGNDFDVGFVALNKLIGLFTNQFWVFSLIADLMFFIPFGIILYRYTTSVRQLVFAFVFYVSLIQVFLIGGGRQVFSIGFDLIALLSIIDRKRFRALFFFLIGISFHFSSILFFLPLLMVWYGLKPRTLKVLHVLAFIAIPVVLAFPNELIRFMGDFVGMEKYSEYGRGSVQGGGTTFLFLIEMLSLFCLIVIRQIDLLRDNSIRIFYVMAPLLTVFAPLIISNGSMIRISMYFHLFLALLVPFAIDCAFNKKQRPWIFSIAILLLAVMALAGGGMQYYFFWQK